MTLRKLIKMSMFVCVSAFAFSFSANTYADTPFCSSSNSDSNNDGLGWENRSNCIVVNGAYDGCVTSGGNWGWDWHREERCQVSTYVNPHSGGGSNDNGDGNNNVVDTNDLGSCPSNSLAYCNNGSNGDPDGDGWGWDGTSSCIVPSGNQDNCSGGGGNDISGGNDTGTAFSFNTTSNNYGITGSDQSADVVFALNGYRANEHSQNYIKWSGKYTGNQCSGELSSPPELEYLINPKYRDFSYVRAFPAVVVGTMGGRFQTWKYDCTNQPNNGVAVANPGPGIRDYLTTSEVNSGSYRNNANNGGHLFVNGQPNGGVLDMQAVAAKTGYPALGNNIPDTWIKVKADLDTADAQKGYANLFIDTYFHFIPSRLRLAGQDQRLVRTVNGINENKTELWNLNIWLDYPDNQTAQTWTGGVRIGEVTRSGLTYDVFVKKERDQANCKFSDKTRPDNTLVGNCFMYVALVVRDKNAVKNGVNIPFHQLAQWFTQAENGFRAMLRGNAQALAIMTKDFGLSDIDWYMPQATENYVIGGLHVGAEIWYNKDWNVPAKIKFDEIAITVAGKGTFGYTDD